MANESSKQTLCQKLFKGSGWALFTMFVWELVEEGFETLIAYCISSAVAIFVTKVLSTLAIITATQGIKVALKRFLLPIIKNLTYKEGNDKMEKFKNFFRTIFANKGTIYGILGSALLVVSGTGVIDVNSILPIYVGTYNLTPLLYYGILAVLFVLATWFPETYEKFKQRIDERKEVKKQNTIIKEAKKEIKKEEKLANQTQAEQEKAKVKAEQEEATKLAKEQADKEYRAKVDEAKAKILAENAKQ